MSRSCTMRKSEFGIRKVRRLRRSSPCTSHSALRAGFTLVELLIVVTIIGLMASVVLPAMNSASSVVSLEAMARTLAADLRIARHSAVQYNTSFAVTFDQTNNSYTVAESGGSGAPGLVNVLSPGTSGNTIDLDQFGAGRSGQSHVVIGGAALKVSKASVPDVIFGPSGGTGPARTQDTVIWLQDGSSDDRRCILITVSWITGAVTVGNVQPYSLKLSQPNF